MKRYEINRMAVLVDLMAECIGCKTDEILDVIQETLISDGETIEIREAIASTT